MKKSYLPTLRSERVLLRPSIEKDIDDRLYLGQNPEYHQYFGDDETSMRSREELYAMWFQDITDKLIRSDYQFAQIEIENKWVGSVSLAKIDFKHCRGDLVLGIYDKKYWGQGYGTEIINMVLNYAFDSLELHRISGNIIANNTRSLKAVERIGFQKEGVLRDYFFINGTWHDSVIVAIKEDEFRLVTKQTTQSPSN